MSSSGARDARAIIQELYTLTRSMTGRVEDADYLVECVEKRQALMDEFDAYVSSHDDVDKGEFRQQISDMLSMDERINTGLRFLKNAAKSKLNETKRRQQAAAYSSSQGHSSGSFMNYTK